MTPNALISLSLMISLTSFAGPPRDAQPLAVQAPVARPEVASKTFTSNGCSGFREARFFTCCFAHDFAFWAGGTWGDRRRADVSLRRCVRDVAGEPISAGFAYMLVRLAIIPGAFVHDGWGRAWYGSDRRRYAPLTPEQRQQVDAEKARTCQAFKLDSQTGKYRVDETREIRPNEARQLCGVSFPGLPSAGAKNRLKIPEDLATSPR